MLDWIFGSSKGQKKQEISPQDKLEEDQLWVYDFVKQYLVSPIWRNPMLDFIEQNCAVFQDTQQNKFQYTKIFQQFTSLCTILVQSIVQQTGISFKTLQKCIIKGLKTKQDKKIYTQILICDNFQTFKRIMISKNKELQAQALKKIREQTKKQDKVQDKIDDMERQRLQIEEAIALSLALQQKVKQQQEQQLKQAIRQSQVNHKKEQPKVQSKGKSLLGELPPLMIGTTKNFDSPSEYQGQKTRLNKQIQQLRSKHKVEEDSQQRKKRLQEQRQLLRKRKQQQRNLQLKTFVENKQANSISQTQVSEQQLLKRKKLMNRLKQQLKND